MKAYEQWKEKRAIKTIGWLNNSSAYIAGEEAGWRAALEWVLSQERPVYYSIPVVPTDIIRKELEDERI